uniref:Huntingtin n=1 Tax=Lygus hesperus TaxID=30085 RepID=A0A0A9YYT2_LYGHE
MVIGNFINSMYHHGHSSSRTWFSKELKLHDKKLDLEFLTALILEGLDDESSITVRHSLTSLGICIPCIIESSEFSYSILEKLLKLVDNPYWLIKVRLVEILCSLPYQCIYYATGTSSFQDKLLNYVIPTLLANEDSRVRKTTAETIVRLVNYLYFPDDYAEDDIVVSRGSSLSSSVFSNIYHLRNDHLDPVEEKIRENKLSRLINVLVKTLIFSTSKHLSHGCIEALSQLSVEFHPSEHATGWLGSCEGNGVDVTSTGLFSTIVTLLTHSPVSLDLECHQWLLTLSGNLFHGLASQFDSSEVFDKKLLQVSEQLLTHVMRILSIFVYVTEESVHQSRLPGLSPLRRKTLKPTYVPKPDDEGKEDKKKIIGSFNGIRHCLKILDIIRAGYIYYKLTLDPISSEKLVNLISHALRCMQQLLLHLKIVEPGQVAEELLGYLSFTFVLDSTTTISVVNQLMKSLFELKSQPTTKPYSADVEKGDLCYGLYAKVLQKPLQELSDHLESSHKPYDPRIHEDTTETSKSSSIKYDRVELAKKIKLFEAIVIQALKEYTMTNNVKLQVEVLALLTQLVNLKVNYCLLDSDQIFIKFVKGQFEYLEAGQIHDAELLIPQIFKFLVHLSNEKNHSKPVISIPEIIQLCDGLMASGQNPVTHCIPALLPVVEHIFLLNVSNIDINELETQREVILAMLVRLAEFPQVLEILNKVMKEGWRWEEHWKRWYRQTVDTILPLLSEGKLLVNDINALHSLLSLNSSFVAPLNYVLVLLFSHQQDGQTIVQWLGMVSTMLLSVCMYKEERVLLQLEEMNLYVREEGDDPLSVNTVSKTLPPQHLLAKLIVRVVLTVVTKLKEYVMKYSEPGQIESLEKTFSNFLLCCIYLFQQGNYEELSKSLATLLKGSGDMETINDCFLVIAYKCPLLTILWADILMVLDKGEPSFWKPLMGECGPSPGRQSLNLEVVKQGSIILYCEYLAKKQQDVKALSWLLDGYIEEVVWNCPELPVEKLLCSIYNLERNSKLLLDAASKCVNHTEPIFTHRLLQTLENIHSNYTGSVLNLVALSLVKQKNIAIARLAAAFCCRTIEYMLTLEKTSVLGLLKKDELVLLIRSLKSSRKQCKRYSGLVSILKKLGEEVYSITKWESDDNRSVDIESIKSLKPDKNWLVEQIRLRCSLDSDPDGVRCTRLLSTLDEDELDAMFLSDNFDKTILQHCFSMMTQLENGKSISSATISNLPPVYRSAKKVLLKCIHEICDTLPSTYNAISSGDVLSHENHLQTLISRLNVKHQLLPLALAINNYLVSLHSLNHSNTSLDKCIPSQSHLDMVRFALLCMRASVPTRKSQTSLNSPNDLQNLVESSCKILSFDLLAVHLKLEEIQLLLTTVLELVVHFTGEAVPTKEFKTDNSTESKPDDLFLQVGISLASLLSWVDDFRSVPSNLPGRMENSLKALIVSLGRLQKLNLLSRLPVEAWQLPLDADFPPPIPMHILHEPDILSQIVNRVRLLGWTNRLQFEEMWVCLLSALTPNPDVDNTDQEEISAIMHANSLAVDGITWLVLSTLSVHNGNSYPSKLLHVPRCGNHKLHLLQYWYRLEEMNDILFWKLQPVSGKWNLSISIADKRPNLERIDNSDLYGFGQLSVPYLQAQITPSDDSPTPEAHDLAGDIQRPASGIDVRSCLQFVLDLYGQWVLPNSGISLNLQLSMVKSVVCLSDMFSESGHYEWMFHTFVALSKSHPVHDEIMHQYLIIGVAKSAAVLQLVEGDNSDKVIKTLESALRNSSSLICMAGIHGVLYLLQTAKTIKKPENASEPVKLSPQEFRQRLLTTCCEFVEKHFTEEIANSVDCELLIALSLFLLEVFPTEVTSPQNLISTLLHLARNPKNKCIYQTVINGLERLVLTGCDESFKDQITRLAMDRFSQADPSLSLPALQLLIACIYSGNVKKEHPEEDSMLLPSDTEIMEKTSALFDKIKKGYPIEVEIVCDILPSILSDFFPVLDVSTKVIGEFLSPNQPHKKNMAAMVFKVFTQACNEKQLFLLQDWVVHSLNSFTQNLPLVTAVWSLCCFFISASANPWLRAIFPHVQSRIRQCEYEDKEIFSIAAVQFFSQLDESQRSIFLNSFKGTATSQMSPFSDVIACLS